MEHAKANLTDWEFHASQLMHDDPPRANLIFCSNVLEHFPNPAQEEALGWLFAVADVAVALVVPFREFDRDPEHEVTYDYSGLPFSMKRILPCLCASL